MKGCEAVGMVGVACLLDSGTGIGSCHAYKECQTDPSLTRDAVLEVASGCKFVQSGQVPPPGKPDQSPVSATK